MRVLDVPGCSLSRLWTATSTIPLASCWDRSRTPAGLGADTLAVCEFIPLSFWYDASLISRDSDRRHDPWLVYGFTELQSRPMAFLDFHEPDARRVSAAGPALRGGVPRPDGGMAHGWEARTARRFTVYQNCPLPTPEDRLLFILVSLKTSTLQVVHGRVFGHGPGQSASWIHVLLPVLLAALRTLGDAPARSLSALAQRLGVSEAAAATVVTPLAEEPAPVVPIPAAVPASPLVPMTDRTAASSAPKTLVNSKQVRAGRKKTTPSKMSCSSMPYSRSSF